MRSILSKNIYFLILLVVTIISCKENISDTKKDINTQNKTLLKYAKGFEIQHFTNYKKLIIKNPYQDSKTDIEFILSKENSSENSNLNQLQIPLKRIVTTSTTHIPMLELLNSEESLIAFPTTNLISSEKTRKRINEGKIKELGSELSMNTEILLNLKPDAVIGFSINNTNKVYATLEKMNIPVIYNGDWLEETPLGRAEWIKFFGVLYDKEALADSIFTSIEQYYLEAKKLAKTDIIQPTILSGAKFKNTWYLPAGESFEAQFLIDANVNYLYKNTKGKGSLSLNIENVFETGNNADIWLSPGFYKSLTDLESADKMYAKFKPFQNQNIYTFANTIGEKGGVLYYELAPTRPDLVLKDIIKISHPSLLKDYELTFYKLLE